MVVGGLRRALVRRDSARAGATAEEVRAALPGDDIISHPRWGTGAPGSMVSARNISRWHEIQSGLAPLYAKLLGVPVVFANKVALTPHPRQSAGCLLQRAWPSRASRERRRRARMLSDEG